MKNLSKKFMEKQIYKKKEFIISALSIGILTVSFTSLQYNLNNSYNDKVGQLHSIGSSEYSFNNLLINPKTLSNLDSAINTQVALNESNKRAEEERLAKQEEEDNSEDILAYEDTGDTFASNSDFDDVSYTGGDDYSSSDNSSSSASSGGGGNSYTPPPVENAKTCEDYGYDSSFETAYAKAEAAANQINGFVGWGTDLIYPEGNLECHRGYYYTEYAHDMDPSKWIYV